MDLITLEEYKLSIKGVKTEDDAKRQALITSVSDFIKQYTNNYFSDYYLTPLVEEFNVNYSGNSIYLSQSLIKDIVKVEVRTEGGVAYEEDLSWHIDKTRGILYKMPDGATWPLGIAAVKVTYTSGTSSPPADIKLATIELVKFYEKEDYKESKSLMGASVNTGSHNRGGGTSKQFTLPPHIQIILDTYRF